jgi:hypothetical protein
LVISSNRRKSGSTSTTQDCVSFDLNDICREGNTFLWDFVQNERFFQINEKLMREAEKQLNILVCYQTNKQIKLKFIEGCLRNLKINRYTSLKRPFILFLGGGCK